MIPDHSDAERRRLRDQFSNWFAEWLENRAAYLRPNGEWTMDTEDAHSKREVELARLITTSPAPDPWGIAYKMEVLKHYMSAEGGTGWADNRELAMLAGIEADLLRYPPAEAGD